jgi:(R,R)-butanediol dehydrogenase / meso-butanediol dehydrogenase / diacetyl reductase
MRAARFHAAGDIRIDDVAEPTITEPDDVIVEVELCGICGTDLHEYLMGPIVTPTEPHPLTGVTNPQILGHEFSGTIVEVGPEAGFAVGQRIAVMPSVVCHKCFYCLRGFHTLCTRFASLGLSAAWGGLAKYAKLKPYQVAPIPDSMSFEEGAMIEPAAVAAYGVDRAGVTGGDNVLVLGAGPVGGLTALYAAAVGAGNVVIVEPNPQRAALAKALDVGPVVHPDELAAGDLVAELTGGIGFDLSVECSGSEPGLQSAVAATRRRGSVVQTGLHTKPAAIDMMRVAESELTLYGSWCFKITDWPRVIRLVARGEYPVTKALSSVIELDEVVTGGFDVLVDPQGSDMKILVRP